MAAVDLDRPMEAVRELRRRVRDDGFAGLRMLPWLWGAPPTDRRYYPLYAECVELGVHSAPRSDTPVHDAVGDRPSPSRTSTRSPSTSGTSAIVCGHIGYPWTEEMIAVARKHENVYIDTSAYTTKRLPRELVEFMRDPNRGRKVLFGSNFPMIRHSHALDGLDDLGLSDETRAAYLGGNAERVFTTLATRGLEPPGGEIRCLRGHPVHPVQKVRHDAVALVDRADRVAGDAPGRWSLPA